MGTEIVCVSTGERFGDVYAQRLHNMLCRNFEAPFRLTCLTDRRRDLPSEVQQVDIKGFQEQGFFNKMLLYNPEVLPIDGMLYMDLSLAIKSDVSHLASYGRGLDKDLVVIHDWKRPVLNTCVQWITRNDTTKALWEFYKEGSHPEFRTRGDQEFVQDALDLLGLGDRIGYFEDGEIQSFKVLRAAHRRSDEAFRALWEKTKIVKFHGIPRQHHVLSPWQRFWNVTVRYPHYARKDWNFLVDEIREMWR